MIYLLHESSHKENATIFLMHALVYMQIMGTFMCSKDLQSKTEE